MKAARAVSRSLKRGRFSAIQPLNIFLDVMRSQSCGQGRWTLYLCVLINKQQSSIHVVITYTLPAGGGGQGCTRTHGIQPKNHLARRAIALSSESACRRSPSVPSSVRCARSSVSRWRASSASADWPAASASASWRRPCCRRSDECSRRLDAASRRSRCGGAGAASPPAPPAAVENPPLKPTSAPSPAAHTAAAAAAVLPRSCRSSRSSARQLCATASAAAPWSTGRLRASSSSRRSAASAAASARSASASARRRASVYVFYTRERRPQLGESSL